MTRVPEYKGGTQALLISLCAVANKALDVSISRPAADELVERVSRELPPPPLREELRDDSWRDAVALFEAVAQGDLTGARALLVNSPDTSMLLGNILQVLSILLGRTTPDVVTEVAAEARRSGPPPA